jgi:hypothetical protein
MDLAVEEKNLPEMRMNRVEQKEAAQAAEVGKNQIEEEVVGKNRSEEEVGKNRSEEEEVGKILAEEDKNSMGEVISFIPTRSFTFMQEMNQFV